MKLVLAALTLLVLSGCASQRTLNDPARSQPGSSIASSGVQSSGLAYESKTIDGVTVSYNLSHLRSELILNLIFKNNTNTRIKVSPEIIVSDASGLQIRHNDFQSEMMLASMEANMPIPYEVQSAGSSSLGSYYSSGTITSVATGNTYNYSGYSSSTGFASGFQRGQAIGNDILAAYAAGARGAARERMQWMTKNWLRASYLVEPNLAVSGALTFPSGKTLALPIMVKVKLDRNVYEFKTVSE